MTRANTQTTSCANGRRAAAMAITTQVSIRIVYQRAES